MAAWQHDYRLLPQSKLKEYYGMIPETLQEADYDKYDWWTGASQPDPLEIEKILPPMESWSETVKMWGSDRGDRLSLYYSENGELQSVELRFDLRREFPEVREFVKTVVTYADMKGWCFRTDDLAVLMPEYEILAKGMSISDAQEFMDTHPAANSVDDL